jgi:putative Mn2+ efflux pump MntP
MTYSQLMLFLLIGTGLSFDSFAVSVSCGLVKKQISFREAVPVALSLALFQALFPVMGWYAGMKLHGYIETFDHWVAFIFLAFIGLRMMLESRRPESPNIFKSLSFRVVLGLSVTTSIDALVVGVSFGVLEMSIFYPVVIIGLITFMASMLGMLCGKSIPSKHSRYSYLLGGFVLMAIGFKILVEHLWFL